MTENLALFFNVVFIGIIFGFLIEPYMFRNSIARKISEAEKDGKRIYITGDKHGDLGGIKKFCKKSRTNRDNIMIILGDSGFNYYEDERDDKLKSEAAKIGITLFCIHGNKECRPQNIKSYGVQSFHGGRVYYEPQFPNILFAVDGETYDFNGKKYCVLGGAHSVDKLRCIESGTPYWDDEMPDQTTLEAFETALKGAGEELYGIMTHTCPMQYIPAEMFLSNRRIERDKKLFSLTRLLQRRQKEQTEEAPLDIDRSLEEWLGKIERNTNYSVWYCGHYHVNKRIDKLVMLYDDIVPLGRGTDD